MSNDKLVAALRDMGVRYGLTDLAAEALAANDAEQAQAAEPVAEVRVSRRGSVTQIDIDWNDELRCALVDGTKLYTLHKALTPDQEREKFEEWADLKEFYLAQHMFKGQPYVDSDTEAAWMAWQARAALAGGTK